MTWERDNLTLKTEKKPNKAPEYRGWEWVVGNFVTCLQFKMDMYLLLVINRKAYID